MFGYRLIKNVEIEHLKSDLAHANVVIADQTKRIAELLATIDEQKAIIAREMAQLVVERFDNNGEEDVDDEDMVLDESAIMDAPNIE